MDRLTQPDFWIGLGSNIWGWFQEYAFTWAAATQLAVVVLSFLLAQLLTRRLRVWLLKYRAHPTTGRAIGIVLPLLFPLAWLILDWVGLITLRYLQPEAWPDAWLLDSIAGLLAAWVAIRLVSQLVRNPVLASIFVWSAWTIAALNLLDLLDGTIGLLQGAELFRLAGADDESDTVISLYTIVSWTISLFVLLSVSIYLSSFLESRIRTIQALSPSLQVLFVKSLKIVLIGLAVIIAITSAGIDLTALAVFGGALGVGIGFGLQKIVSNLISGVILLVDKSIKPGDVIAVSGTYGWVTALGGRYVSVVTRDGVEHLIPNEMLISERVENWTHSHSRTRLKVDVGVHYQTDVHKAIELCLEAAKESERVLVDPEPKCLLIEFGDNSVNLQLRFWIADAHNGVQNVKSAVLLRVWDMFRESGIEIPYPQRDLHLRSGFEVLKPAR